MTSATPTGTGGLTGGPKVGSALIKNKLKNKNKKNRPSNLFDIDNFIVSNICGSRKITESKNPLESIVIPKYKKLNASYYNAPSFKIQKYGEENLASDVIINLLCLGR